MYKAEEHNHNGTYVRMETCSGKLETTNLRFTRNEGNIARHEKEIEAINKKITATLVFAIVTLVGMVLTYIKI